MFLPTRIQQHLTPSLRYGLGGFTSTVTTFTITPVTPPLKGSLLIIFMAANTSAAAPDTIPTGFTQLPIGSGVQGLYVLAKISDGTETSFTFTYPISRSPAWYYQEWLNLDLVNYNIIRSATGLATESSPWTPSSWDIPFKGVCFLALAKTDTALLTASAGWTTISSSGQQKAASRIYTGPITSQTLTWTRTGGGTFDKNYCVLIFHAKKNRF